MVANAVAGGARISTVVPGKARGDASEDHALTDMDLAMKLHYIRGVYLFENADKGDGDDYLSLLVTQIEEIKRPMFPLLDRFFVAAGRVRRSEGPTGRPYIKCNDAGVRIVEASSDKTVQEWLRALQECDDHNYDDGCHGGLCYDHVIGPDLGFSPLVYLQFTRFKCGGFSVGLSWAHLLGDILSASTFINTWAQIMAGHVPPEPTHVPHPPKPQHKKPANAISPLKELVTPVANHWRLNNRQTNMKTHSFRITPAQLDRLISDAKAPDLSRPFDVISAILWQILSDPPGDPPCHVATFCRYGKEGREIPSNANAAVSTVEADARAMSDAAGLARRIAAAEAIDVGDGYYAAAAGDRYFYGANLTFVELEEVEIYGAEVKGNRAAFANYTIGGVGEEGLVLVLPAPGPRPRPSGEEKYCATTGRTVTVVLKEDRLASLRDHLNQRWNIC